MAKEVYTRSVRIGERTYRRLAEMKRVTGVPITKLIDRAMDEMEKRDDRLRGRD